MIPGLPDRVVATAKGLTVRVRPCVEADADALYAIEAALVEDGRGQVLAPTDLADRARFADRLFARLQSKDAVLVAVVDGAVVASGSVNRLGPSLCRHVGDFEVGVALAFQGRGVGRALSVALIDAARQVGIERLQLYVRADNARAIALYRSLGFTHESTRVGFVKLPGGEWIDDLTMVTWLANGTREA